MVVELPIHHEWNVIRGVSAYRRLRVSVQRILLIRQADLGVAGREGGIPGVV